jgi:hypothetical protein
MAPNWRLSGWFRSAKLAAATSRTRPLEAEGPAAKPSPTSRVCLPTELQHARRALVYSSVSVRM